MTIKKRSPKAQASLVIRRLKKEYPSAKVQLKYSNPIELLFSTILSAQCTDRQVNIVTKDLFKKYRKLGDYLSVPIEELENDIRSTGFFRSKTKSLRGSALKIIEDFEGEVPQTMEELITLPGVARKTANIVLANAFGVVEGIAVDTHVKRLTGRIGLTRQATPEKIEQDMMKIVQKKDWPIFTDLLIAHGRAVCDARRPRCGQCTLADICPSYKILVK